MREEVSYGPADRAASVRRLRGGALESTLSFAWEDGALVRVEDSESGVERYAYDAAGRRVTTEFAGGERLQLAYDVRSRTRSESFVTAQGGLLATLSYAHDLADRRIEIADASGALVATTYEDGRIAEQRSGNGLVRSHAYRSDGVLTGTTTRDAGGSVLEQTTLEGEVQLDELTGVLRAPAARDHDDLRRRGRDDGRGVRAVSGARGQLPGGRRARRELERRPQRERGLRLRRAQQPARDGEHELRVQRGGQPAAHA